MEKNAPQGQGKDVKKGAKKWWLLCTFDNFFYWKKWNLYDYSVKR